MKRQQSTKISDGTISGIFNMTDISKGKLIPKQNKKDKVEEVRMMM